MRVSLVGTIHAESGQASIEELYAILERSRPEAIFAEISPADVDRYKDGSHGNLESTAVARYLAGHCADLVPVDLAEPEQRFFDNAKDMFAAVERTSSDYRRMMDNLSVDILAGGFPYLNSDRCSQSWADIYREVQATIEWTGERRLRETYDLWNHTNELREREMMKNIAIFCARNSIACGVFLVGAAHRQSIIDRGFAGDGTGLPGIEWDLSGFLRDAG